MAVYTVHTRGEGSNAARDAVFVREGFSRAAFVFGPLWLLRYRLWFAALVWLFVAIALSAAAMGLAGWASFALLVLFAGLTGIEANDARRRALTRRGYAIRDIVAATDRDAAERRFFDRAATQVTPPPVRTNPAARPGTTPVLGLFPEAEGRG